MPNKLAEELVPGRPPPDEEDMENKDDEDRREVVALRVRRGRAGVTGMHDVGSPTR